jgi:hypothetical protein
MAHDTTDNFLPDFKNVEQSPGIRRQQLLLKLEALLRERNGTLPVWIRAPVQGPEFFSGITRPKLYQLAADGHIKSVSLRETGKLRGVRLFHLESILRYIARQASADESQELPITSSGNCGGLKHLGAEK